LKAIAGVAERADIEFRGEPLMGNALRVQVTRPDFAEDDINRLAPLVSSAGVTELDLTAAPVSDAGLAKLRWADSILVLRLRKTLITPAALSDISHINPTLLDLRETSIRAKDLMKLEAPQLKYLLLTDPTFRREDMA
jgi:hypothetical protein